MYFFSFARERLAVTHVEALVNLQALAQFRDRSALN